MKALRLLIVPSPSFRFLHSGYHLLIVPFVPWLYPSPVALTIFVPGPVVFLSRLPTLWRLFLHLEPMSSPRFLGNPFSYICPALGPRRLRCLRLLETRCCSRDCYYESSRYAICFRGSITRLLYPLSTLRALITLTRKTRFRPVANLFRVGVSPTGLR